MVTKLGGLEEFWCLEEQLVVGDGANFLQDSVYLHDSVYLECYEMEGKLHKINSF